MEENELRIGQVRLDLSAYTGNDQYSDGAIEDVMLELAQAAGGGKVDEGLLDSWALYYHFSPIRENIISWLPIRQHESVLEIGAGCGAVSGMFCQMAGDVHAVELSLKRSRINAHRHANCSNLQVKVGNFEEIGFDQKYDWVSMIGVLEYASLYLKDPEPYLAMLDKSRSLLKPGGRLILAIENKFGMKYWAGCREDHTGNLFESLQGYHASSQVRTFGKNDLEALLVHAGFRKNAFFYPFPDYKLPERIYSDSYLPEAGTLHNHLNNYDQDRLYLFNETLAWNEVIKAGQFPFFSNSFLVVSSIG